MDSMDGDGGNDGSTWFQTIDSLVDVPPQVKQVLSRCGSTAKEELVDELVEHISPEVLDDTRTIIFNEACKVLKNSCDPSAGGKTPVLILKKRKGTDDAKANKNSKDICDLTLFICKLASFPREILTNSSTYIDVTDSINNPSSGSDHLNVPNVSCNCALEKVRFQLETQISMYKNYVLNLEKVHGDEIQKLKLEITKLKSSPGIGTRQASGGQPSSETPQRAESHASAEGSSQNANSRNASQAEHSDDPNINSSSQMTESDQDQSESEDDDDVYDTSVSEDDDDSIILGHTMERGTSPTYPEKEKTKVKIDTSDQKPKPKKTPKGGNVSNNNHNKGQKPKPQRQRQPVDEQYRLSKHEIRKDKKNIRRNQKETERKLTGIRQEESMELYVRNIHRRPDETLKDIAEMVKRYCQKGEVRVMDARTITNRVCKDTVGCKIRVPLRQVDDVLQDRFWPIEVSCRKWGQRVNNDFKEPREKSFTNTTRGRPDRRQTNGGRSRSRSNAGSVRSRSESRPRSRQYRNAFNDEFEHESNY